MFKMTREYVNFRKFMATKGFDREHFHTEAEYKKHDKFDAAEHMLMELVNLMDGTDPEKLVFKIDILNDEKLPVERVTYKFKEEA